MMSRLHASEQIAAVRTAAIGAAKPEDRAEAIRQLQRLAGHRPRVAQAKDLGGMGIGVRIQPAKETGDG